ncbi:MAG TPA: fused MFS/spermidine synthase, partial [Myxococcota bacterium]
MTIPAPPPELPALVATEVDEPLQLAVARTIKARVAGMFGDVFVVDEDGIRYLRFGHVDAADQSGIDPKQPSKVQFEYVRIAALALDRHDVPKPARRALVVGLGGGAFARLLIERVAHVAVDAVEIDPVVVDVARRWFALPITPRLQVHVDDGARFMTTAKAGYDVVLLDAFSGDDMPSALSTAAFFHDVHRVLADDGVVVMNVALIKDGAADAVTRRFAQTFPGCVVITAKTEENRILVGARTAQAAERWRSAAVRSPASLGFDVLKDVESFVACPAVTTAGGETAAGKSRQV